uniref:RNase H type-1 domain-containing protein n=1 Tax=Peronospora matthiolae TaxID=2874970 RepID=A0AAV1U2V7_9STRA
MQLVTSRVASRLGDIPAPRGGPPLPRSVVVSRIADRIPPPELTEEEDKKDDDSDGEDINDDPYMDGERPLRFGGARRANPGPGPGGAGAALFESSGHVMWMCTADYTALLLGIRAAADHGVTRLRIKGDSTLVIQQVRGIFATRNKSLRQLRIAVKAEQVQIEPATLHPIDRQANGHADRLPTPLLTAARPRWSAECTPMDVDAPPHPRPPLYPHLNLRLPRRMSRGSRLRLRRSDEDEQEAAFKLVERLAAKIMDSYDWEEAESYITALPYALYDQPLN